MSMKPEVVFGTFLAVDTIHGMALIPADAVTSLTEEQFLAQDEDEQAEQVLDYTEASEIDDINGVEFKTGWFSRYAMPGCFMDATDWNGPYDTLAVALEEVVELYGDDDLEYEF